MTNAFGYKNVITCAAVQLQTHGDIFRFQSHGQDLLGLALAGLQEKHPAHTFGDNRYSGRTFAHGNLPTTRGATGAGAVSDFQASEARPWGLFGFAPWVGGKAHGPYVW